MVYLYKRQKIFAITENFKYFDEHQNLVFSARGNFWGFPKRYHLFRGTESEPIIEVTRKMWTIMPRFIIRDLNTGHIVAEIRQRFRIGGSRFDITSFDGSPFRIEGSFWAHNFKIFNQFDQQIIEVKKKVLAWADTYEIMIDETQIPVHIAAAISLTIDCAIHNRNT